MRCSAALRACVVVVAAAAAGLAAVAGAPAASASRTPVPRGMPDGVPAAALQPEPALPHPSASVWPFPEAFPRTSGTGRLAGGASFWTDWVYDDHGAASLGGFPTGQDSEISSLAPTQGVYSYPDGPAHKNGADVFRTATGMDAKATYWRVDWNTLVDAKVPIAEWTFDTDDNAATGASTWPAGAQVSSPGIERALVVSSRGARLLDAVTGKVLATLPVSVDMAARSFVVRVPRTTLPVSGTWRVRMAAGLADASGTGFAEPTLLPGVPVAGLAGLPRTYNVTYRRNAQEPPVYTDGLTDSLVALAGSVLATGPLAGVGADGQTRFITGNFWMEDHQADALVTGDVSPFSRTMDWSALAAHTTTPEPMPTGYSNRWYVTTLHLGQGAIANPSTQGTGDLRPNYLGRVQPYAVYVPTTYRRGTPTPLTWILHSLSVNLNQYGAYDPQLMQQLCEQRHSICATTEGFAPDMWYFDEAEVDFWQVWHRLASAYTLDPDRTALTGYSMGGWAAYKLGFAHPDLFATALSLEGPPTCGIEIVPGSRLPSDQDPKSHCYADGDSTKLVASARWLPYGVSQGAVDELVPVTSGLAQVQLLDKRNYRYHFEFFPAEDHLVYATQDRFGTLASWVGNRTRKKNPGHVSYAWYPDLDRPAFGIGTTTAYWLSGLKGRGHAPGQVASIEAVSRGIPDAAITVHRSGPSLQVANPTPSTVFDLTWSTGGRPAGSDRLSLDLHDVGAVTVDARRAGLTCPTVIVTSDGTATVRFTSLRPHAVVTGGRTGARTDGAGDAAVAVGSGRSTLRVCSSANAVNGSPLPSGSSAGAGGSLAATGTGAALPSAAVVLMAVGAVTRRRRAD
ncbi:MAG TPA: peptidase [Mycobacteriales bacterium]|nr:peptidase [Mycobacteriales bacterium]